MDLCNLSVDSQLNETLRLVDPIGALDGLLPLSPILGLLAHQ